MGWFFHTALLCGCCGGWHSLKGQSIHISRPFTKVKCAVGLASGPERHRDWDASRPGSARSECREDGLGIAALWIVITGLFYRDLQVGPACLAVELFLAITASMLGRPWVLFHDYYSFACPPVALISFIIYNYMWAYHQMWTGLHCHLEWV